VHEWTRLSHSWRCDKCGSDDRGIDPDTIPNYSEDPRLFVPLLEELYRHGYLLRYTRVLKSEAFYFETYESLNDTYTRFTTGNKILGVAICEAWLKWKGAK
jgi:hypothetical protein